MQRAFRSASPNISWHALALMAPSAVIRTSHSGLSPFRHRMFTVIWISTVVSNIGGWMSAAASGWLMTSLDSSPFIVSMVQVATSLPMFLLAIPAGALSDIVDRRKFLLVGELSIMAGIGRVRRAGHATPDHADEPAGLDIRGECGLGHDSPTVAGGGEPVGSEG